MGTPGFQSLNVAQPDFFKQLQVVLDTTSLDNWKTYLTWHLVQTAAPMLPALFVKENFDFYGKTLDRRRGACGRAGSAA